MTELSTGRVKLTQAIATGVVSVPANTATKILSANLNRRSARLTLAGGGTSSAIYFGTSSSVSSTTGFSIPFIGPFSTPVIAELDWQTEIWAYSSAAISMSFADESVS